LWIALAARATGAEPPAWVEPMRKVHAGFKGEPGYVAQLGDSITTSLAFWSPLGWDDPEKYLPKEDDSLPKTPRDKRWRDVIRGVRDKGTEHGNNGGWRVENVLSVIDKVLADKQPEVAVIMIGTNDIRGNRVPDGYRAGVAKIVDKCLAANCVPMLTTIPPMKGHDESVAAANKIIRALAEEKKLPLIDYHAAIIERRPEKTWLGTLISDDGVHPTAGKTNDYSKENLQVDGYALRNWVTFLKLREVYFGVLND
jgi:lysophospholipase L1-like esterase